MLSKVFSSSLLGIDAHLVEVEVDIAPGLPRFFTVGLPDNTVKESNYRVKAAITNSGLFFPMKRITVNLAPADLKKEGSAFDLPMVLAILRASGIIKSELLDKLVVLGELSLDGRVKPIKGALPVAVMVKDKGMTGLIIPDENSAEAAIVSGIEVYPVESLSQTVDFLNGVRQITPLQIDSTVSLPGHEDYLMDFAEVKGQWHVKRALEVAAAGGHNLIMIGPPGSGKSMLAQRLPSVLPTLSLEEAIETTKIHSVAGFLTKGNSLIAGRPFRSPHHTISNAGLVGGGSYPSPGEISLAHNGVLFLDELPEFRRDVLEVLRQPLEDGEVTISRAAISVTYPARFMLAAAMNPCPCGFSTDPKRNCTCSPLEIKKYISKISGPLMDRIDLHVEVPAVKYTDLTSERKEETSNTIRERVNQARKIQLDRYRGEKIFANAQMQPRHIKRYCQIGPDSQHLLEMAIDQLGLSARAYNRILKVARTIADLAGEPSINSSHISEAIQYRTLDREKWY
ncbi:MAG: YifB family Mg chelatase-like AAA ATPase [Candidatus Tectomicrobia bacterium]|uniref:YifB family Mg chelatase-like AAA ATPase n=1 Tax=Tectimicrobiota bacterium TaxID=2528274 RepID=A0A933LRG7_UNCTE|nr:YifB family Mg chelatase-like AAA ATPase [Candidatus Tectomicrobia bacterium]